MQFFQVLMVFFTLSYYGGEPGPSRGWDWWRTVKTDELLVMSAKDVLDEMKHTNLFTVCTPSGFGTKQVDWPKKEDIPYLLSVVESKEPAGIFFSCYLSIWPDDEDTISTVGDAALVLLYARMNGGYTVSLNSYSIPENKDEIIAWARAEAAKILFAEQVLPARSISKEELTKMSAKEYIGMMRQTSVLAVPTNISFWPKIEDIPYLLMLTESNQYAGSTISTFDDLNAVRDYESTVGITAVILLRAITEGEFNPYMTKQYPADKDEIIARAMEVVKTGELTFSPLVGNASFHQDEILRMTAREIIEELKKTDILTLCSREQGDFMIQNWPKREDIPYLLSVSESKERSGVFYWCYFSFIPFDESSTVGDTALLLLNAIKSGGFDMRYLPKPEKPEELLVWARGEVVKMQAENSQGAFVTP
ncbi:MAG: hypothetical protein H6856_07110 [Rhodospirillales bacterium]|nr:hypothetical protein [Rhodospirillales bacterium]